jgi:SAM-dependent methyltransferase
MANQPIKNKASLWEGRWASEHFSPSWSHRGVSREIVDAALSGWFPSGAPVLDVGCGTGEIAAWFAKRGHEALGVDIAPSAVARASKMHAPLPSNLQFMTLDATRDPLPNRQFQILIDRGCFHTISPDLVRSYTRNVASVAAPGARMLLFIKAFRHGRPMGDPQETQMHVNLVCDAYAGRFNVARHAPTYLNGRGEGEPRKPRPGLVFWLVAPGGGTSL